MNNLRKIYALFILFYIFNEIKTFFWYKERAKVHVCERSTPRKRVNRKEECIKKL